MVCFIFMLNLCLFPPDPISTDDDFKLDDYQYKYGYQLVELIRTHFGQYFVIIVAGYPCGHPEATSYEEDLKFLKKKVRSHASFFVRFCRDENVRLLIHWDISFNSGSGGRWRGHNYLPAFLQA